MRLAGLHPAQCRTTPARHSGRPDRALPGCCGIRLDQAGSRQHASPGLLALQEILGLLDPDGPASTDSAGVSAPPGSYFADLRALSLLVSAERPVRLRGRAQEPGPRTQRPRHAPGQLPAAPQSPGELGRRRACLERPHRQAAGRGSRTNARPRGPQAPGRVRLRLGPRDLRRTRLRPRPIEAVQPPAVREHWRRTWNFTWWSLLTSGNPGSIDNRLRAELDDLATALATTIDPSAPAGSTLGTAPLYLSRHPRRPRKPRTLTVTAG